MLSFASKKTAIMGRQIVKVLASRHINNSNLSSWLVTRNEYDDAGGPQTRSSMMMMLSSRSFHTTRPLLTPTKTADDKNKPVAPVDMVSHNFPDFIEHWNRAMFHKVGYGLTAATVLSFAMSTAVVPSIALGLLTFGYWKVGLNDIKQSTHTLNRNYPVLGHVRYIFEVIRPELRQYIVESDTDGKPFDRNHRSQIYRRAKGNDDTIPFGTRRNVYEVHHEWACHSMWPVKITSDEAKRTTVGTAEFGTTKPYSASVFNISGMSYGAISDNAILALNQGAKRANCFQNTGEGGVSRFHMQGGGDLVWNIVTGCFGCGSGTGENRVFEPSMFQETLEKANGQIKMVEIKLSQGAKPGKGGILPRAKITKEIAEARRLEFPPTDDCHSPRSGFAVVRTLALGADYTSAARAFMMSIGCIQALKCNTNKCPTGIATLDKDLMYGLDPALKSTRVYNYHSKTVKAAAEIVGIMGKSDLAQVNGKDIMRRISEKEVKTLAEIFPEPTPGSLLIGTANSQLQDLWPVRGTQQASA